MATVTPAIGARSQLLIKKQNALGTVATGNFNTLRYASHSLRTVIGGVVSEEIRSDREVEDYRQGNRHGEGDINVELCFADHDLLLESMMFNTFSVLTSDTQEMEIGTAPQYLSIEDGQLDLTQFRMFQDMIVGRAAFQFRSGADAIVKATFSLVGTDGADWAGASGGGTAVAATGHAPFDSFNGGIFHDFATGEEIATVTSLDINIDNGAGPIFALGQQEGVFVEYDRGAVTGQATVLFTDLAEVSRFEDETEFQIRVRLNDPSGNVLDFNMDRCKYTAADVPVANRRSRLITLPFIALREATTSALVVRKNPA